MPVERDPQERARTYKIERCAVCRKPVQYEGDVFCYRCGTRSELDDAEVIKRGDA